MTDTVRLTRIGPPTRDDLDTVVPGTKTVVYDGRGLVEPQTDRSSQTVEAGGQNFDAHDYVAKLPVAVDVHVGDVVTVLDSEDPAAKGKSWTVMAVPTSGHAVQHRCPCDPS